MSDFSESKLLGLLFDKPFFHRTFDMKIFQIGPKGPKLKKLLVNRQSFSFFFCSESNLEVHDKCHIYPETSKANSCACHTLLNIIFFELVFHFNYVHLKKKYNVEG
jgi:hypothetical protein